MRATLIHNPTAGDERPSAQDLEEMISEAGFQVRYQSTKKNWKKALKDDADIVVAAGGDGTIAKVLKKMAGRDVPVAVLPLGTANNVGRSLGVVGDVRQIVNGWKSAKPRPFDLGVISSAGGIDHEPFVEACGGGLFAQAVALGEEHVEEATTFVGNETDRALGLLRRLLEKSQPRKWQVEVDGEDHSGAYLAVEVMNIRFAGPGIPLAPAATPGDGKLDVVMIREGDRRELLDYVDRRLAHDDVDLPELTVARGVSVKLRGPKGPLRVDDDLHDGLKRSVEIELRPGAVQILAASLNPGRRSNGRSAPASRRGSDKARIAKRT